MKSLTPPQFEAAVSVDGPCLILAGAGSGKTRVVTFKMAYLISQQIAKPFQILGVTFTNKAAGELKARLSQMLGTDLRFPWLGTFHSICVRILRLALPDPNSLIRSQQQSKNFSIYDDDDQKKVIRKILKQKDMETNAAEVRKIKSVISGYKNKGILPTEALDLSEYFEQRILAEVYQVYQVELAKHNAFDFDDLLFEAVQILKIDSELRGRFRKQFKYVFVDEFQDTNPVQYELIRLLIGVEFPNITVVGDDDQSIYGWRGADLRILQNFHKDFDGAKVFKLEENFRSSANIVRAAGSVIENNTRLEVFKKKIFSTKQAGSKVLINHFEDEYKESEQISLDIAMKGASQYRHTAIFYRTNAQSRLFEEVLRKRGIPYRLIGGMSFFQRKEIKDILGYMRFVVNPSDEQSLLRIINTPKRGIGATSITKLQNYARTHLEPLGDVLGRANLIIGASAAKKVEAFAISIQKLREQCEKMALPVFIEELLRVSAYQDYLEKEKGDEAQDRLNNIEEFISAVVDADEANPGISLEEFLQEQALVSDVKQENSEESVTLMTLHASKGLEFPHVYMSGCVDGIMPLVRDSDSDELEEERRLFYVGATRAEDTLSISTARIRKVRGMDEVFKASRFLAEMDKNVCTEEDFRSYNSWQSPGGLSWRKSSPQRQSPFRRKPQQDHDSISEMNNSSKTATKPIDNWRQGLSNVSGQSIASEQPSFIKKKLTKESDSFNQDFLYLDIGCRVVHPKYGLGTVTNSSGQGENTRVEIRFNQAGTKKLVLKFANLKIVS